MSLSPVPSSNTEPAPQKRREEHLIRTFANLSDEQYEKAITEMKELCNNFYQDLDHVTGALMVSLESVSQDKKKIKRSIGDLNKLDKDLKKKSKTSKKEKSVKNIEEKLKENTLVKKLRGPRQ